MNFKHMQIKLVFWVLEISKIKINMDSHSKNLNQKKKDKNHSIFWLITNRHSLQKIIKKMISCKILDLLKWAFLNKIKLKFKNK